MARGHDQGSRLNLPNLRRRLHASASHERLSPRYRPAPSSRLLAAKARVACTLAGSARPPCCPPLAPFPVSEPGGASELDPHRLKPRFGMRVQVAIWMPYNTGINPPTNSEKKKTLPKGGPA